MANELVGQTALTNQLVEGSIKFINITGGC